MNSNNSKPIDMRDVAKLFLWTFLTVAGVLLLMVLSDLINPHTVEVTVTPEMIIYPDSDDWGETAAALGVDPDSLTMDEFMAHDSIGGPTFEEGVKQLREFMSSR